MVSIAMIAYNHQDYIAQAIENVLLQKTNFPIEIIIAEDCSTDNTLKIAKKYEEKYPNIIRVLKREKNLGMIDNEYDAIKSSKGKYLAYCEGDDFWTDPYKLQKQVDFLEQYPEYGMVHGDVNHLYQDTQKQELAYNKKNNIKIPSGNIFNYLLLPSHSIKTMTVCLRKEILDNHYISNQEIMNMPWIMIDISLWLCIAQYSKIKYMDEVFATYRLLPESMSRTQSPIKLFQFHQKIIQIRDYFWQKFSQNKEIKKQLDREKVNSQIIDAYRMNYSLLAISSYYYAKKHKVKLTYKQYLLIGLTLIKSKFRTFKP